jgi:hypothetical protein
MLGRKSRSRRRIWRSDPVAEHNRGRGCIFHDPPLLRRGNELARVKLAQIATNAGIPTNQPTALLAF